MIGMVFYSLSALVFSKILQSGIGLALANITWDVLSSLYGLIIGTMIFSEVITPIQLVGCALGIISLGLLS
jgi:multidrug transporter EmrE-like cation transporter